jgi:hypothetical protein
MVGTGDQVELYGERTAETTQIFGSTSPAAAPASPATAPVTDQQQ